MHRFRSRFRAWFIGALLIATLGPLTACTNHQTQRIKVTVIVEDNGVQRTGSSVMQFTCSESNSQLGGMGIGGCVLSGEAVAVDLKGHGNLFMLLCGSKNFQQDGVIHDIMNARPADAPEAWDLDADDIPRLVSFANLNDPTSVRPVEANQLDAVFGAGVYLKAIHAEYTTEAVTHGQLDKYLPWLKTFDSGENLHGMHFSGGPTLADDLQKYHFQTER